MKQFLLFLLFAFLFSGNLGAAALLRVKQQTGSMTAASHSDAAHYLVVMQSFEPAPFGRRRYSPVPGLSDAEWNNITPAMISIQAAGAALTCLWLMTIIPASIPVLAVVGLGAAAVAIVMGGRGVKRRLRGLAIAGMSIGIILGAAAMTFGFALLVEAALTSLFYGFTIF